MFFGRNLIQKDLMKKLLIKALLTWFLFIPVAIVNGVVRETVYKPYVGDLPAHQISCFIGIAAFILLSFLMLKKVVKEIGTSQLLWVGFLMVLMTIIFEFSFGHFVERLPWERLLYDYNIIKGRLWLLVLLAELVTPLLVKKLLLLKK